MPLARRTALAGRRPGSAVGRPIGVEGDERAVLPQPFQGVEDPFLGVLDVHHDLGVVQQHPATVPLALPAQRLVAGQPELLLHLVDDRLDLPLVVAGHDHEDVGDREPIADVDQHDVGGELVGGGSPGDLGELYGGVGGGHDGPGYPAAATGRRPQAQARAEARRHRSSRSEWPNPAVTSTSRMTP